MAEVQAAEGPKTYDDQDFGWMEDTLYGWRAIAVLGGLLLLQGLLIWFGVAAYSDPNGPLVGISIFLIAGSVAVVFFSYTEAALAMMGSAALGLCVALIVPLDSNPGAGSLFTNAANHLVDFVAFLAFVSIGVVLLATGIVQARKVSRTLDAD